MSDFITTLYYSISADSRKYEAAIAKVEAATERLEILQAKNRADNERAENEIMGLRERHARRQQDLAAAVAVSDTRAINKTKGEIEKLEDKITLLTRNQKVAAEAREIAENRVTKAIKKARQEAERNTGVLGRLKKAIFSVKGAIAGIGFGFAIRGFNAIIDDLDKLGKRARDLGITASAMQELTHQASLAGVSMDKLDVGLKTLARTAGSDVKGKFIELAAQVENGTLSVADANKYFGENALEMMRILEQGEDAVRKMFNASGIDEAASAAERFKDQMENLTNAVMPTLYRYTGAIADNITKAFNSDVYFEDLGKTGLENFKHASEESKKAWLELEKAKLRAQEAMEKTPKKIEQANSLGFFGASAYVDNPEYAKAQKLFLELSEKQRAVSAKLADEESIGKTTKIINEWSAALEKASITDEEFNRLSFKKQKEELKKFEGELKKLTAESDNIKKRQESMRLAREEYDLQLKIRTLEAQGRDKEAQAIKDAQERNRLMKEYGFTVEQANTRLKLQKNLEKSDAKTQYSDEARKKAEEILKRGEGGTIGKKTLADAQAILDGKDPSELSTAMFKKYADGLNGPTPPKKSFKNIKIDAKAAKENLDKSAKGMEGDSATLESINSQMESLNSTISDLKNIVDGIYQRRNN